MKASEQVSLQIGQFLELVKKEFPDPIITRSEPFHPDGIVFILVRYQTRSQQLLKRHLVSSGKCRLSEPTSP